MLKLLTCLQVREIIHKPIFVRLLKTIFLGSESLFVSKGRNIRVLKLDSDKSGSYCADNFKHLKIQLSYYNEDFKK